MPSWSKVKQQGEPPRQPRTLPDADAEFANAARTVRLGGPLRKENAERLLTELAEAFRDEDFQRRLQSLSVDDSAARQTLYLEKQSRILPKFGFEGTTEGVLQMIGELERFTHDETIARKMEENNELLGQSKKLPREKWSSFASACRKLQEEPQMSKGRPSGLGMFSFDTGSGALGTLAASSHRSRLVGGCFADASWSHENYEYDPWPPGKGKPFSLYVAGSWNDFQPVPMIWESGVFSSVITIGAEGFEIFQLLENKLFSRTYYPSTKDARQDDGHTVQGPDGNSDGKSWCIGGYDDSMVRAGDDMDICVFLDASSRIVQVEWQLAK